MIVDFGMRRLAALRDRIASRRMWRSLTQPGSPPNNVRIVGPGGIQTPVSCVYDGCDDRLQYWRVLAPPGDVFGVVFDSLPAHSAIVVSRAPKP